MNERDNLYKLEKLFVSVYQPLDRKGIDGLRSILVENADRACERDFVFGCILAFCLYCLTIEGIDHLKIINCATTSKQRMN